MLIAVLRQYVRVVAEYYRSGATGVVDLEFLHGRDAANARSVSVNLGDRISSLGGLRHLRADLDELSLAAIWVKKPSLTPLRRFERLRKLALITTAGAVSDLHVVSDLTSLQQLQLYGVKPLELGLLSTLTALIRLDITTGRQVGEWSELARLPALKTLELSRIPSITDIRGVEQIASLERLDLNALSNLERVPDLSKAVSLKTIVVWKLRRLKDLAPFVSAPALEQLLLVDMPQIEPDDIRPLLSHPTLRAMSVGTASSKRNEALQHLHGLPAVQLSDPGLA